MSGNVDNENREVRYERLLGQLAIAHRRIEAPAVSAQFSSNVMRSIRVGLVVESPFSAVAVRFAILSSACAMIFLALNFGALNLLSEARFTGVVGIYGFIL